MRGKNGARGGAPGYGQRYQVQALAEPKGGGKSKRPFFLFFSGLNEDQKSKGGGEASSGEMLVRRKGCVCSWLGGGSERREKKRGRRDGLGLKATCGASGRRKSTNGRDETRRGRG
jgi:hypothetical protein